MKTIIAFGFFFFALSFCNLAERFTGKSGTATPNNTTQTNSSDSNTASTGMGTAEKYTLTPEQSNILKDAKEIKWDEQGMSWTLPSGWKKTTSNPTTFMCSSPQGTFLIVNVSPMSADFPNDVSIKAYYDGAVTRQKNGELEKLRYLELDGVRGVEFLETEYQGKGSPRRHQWIGYRQYAGQNQMLNVMLSTNGANFDKNRDIFAAVMSSTKITR
jgi:hypothetical protein